LRFINRFVFPLELEVFFDRSKSQRDVMNRIRIRMLERLQYDRFEEQRIIALE